MKTDFLSDYYLSIYPVKHSHAERAIYEIDRQWVILSVDSHEA